MAGVQKLLVLAGLVAGALSACDNNLDFKVEAARVRSYYKFEHDWLFGTWFLSRWYLPQEKNVTDEKYDQQLYGYQKSGLPNTAFCDHFSRQKDKQCCDPPLVEKLSMVRPGVYELTQDGNNRPTALITYAYANAGFLLEIQCLGVNQAQDKCTDYGAAMWSRCPNKPRPQDIAKAIDTLNDICYPDMKRFLVAKHHKVQVGEDKWRCNGGVCGDGDKDFDFWEKQWKQRDRRHGRYDDDEMGDRRRYMRDRYDDKDDDEMRGRRRGGDDYSKCS